MEINFYQVDDILYKSIAPLLLKILEENKKALIFCQDEVQVTEIDTGLWSFSKTKFLPHGTKAEKINPLEQPIFITNENSNFNQSQYLLIFDDAEESFLKQFEKIFYFFSSSNVNQARALWKKYKPKSSSLNFYKKEDSGWVKKEL